MRAGLVICVWFSYFQVIWSQDPLVMTTNGLVRGSRATDGAYSIFLGIPYALVDPGNPFGNNLPHPIFNGILDAHTESPACPQVSFGSGEIFGSLDCLTVNVYVPSTASSNNRVPVMVWIYGGGFEGGSGSQSMYGPQYLVRHDVILVTLNYRLGPYGFMCLDLPSVPGNAGLKDQQSALLWVHDNIESFGGDKDKVTIFGQSAGAGSCEYHILNSASNDLFSQAILHSATVFTDGIIEKKNPSLPLELAQQLGFSPQTVEEALDNIKNVSTNEVIEAGRVLNINYKPCIEETFDDVDGFLVTSPQRLLESGNYRGIPMMIGHTSTESRNDNNRYKNIYDTLNSRFNFVSEMQLERAVKIVRDFYVGHEVSTQEDWDALGDFDSDFTNNYGSDRSILYHLAQSNSPIYQFVFGYIGSHTSMGQGPMGRNISTSGVSHGGDLSYLFKRADVENDQEDQLVTDRFSAMWTNFAKYGDPTPEVSELLPVRWPAVSRVSRDYLWIDSELHLGQKLFHDRIAFWDLFFVAYGEYFWLS